MLASLHDLKTLEVIDPKNNNKRIFKKSFTGLVDFCTTQTHIFVLKNNGEVKIYNLRKQQWSLHRKHYPDAIKISASGRFIAISFLDKAPETISFTSRLEEITSHLLP